MHAKNVRNYEWWWDFIQVPKHGSYCTCFAGWLSSFLGQWSMEIVYLSSIYGYMNSKVIHIVRPMIGGGQLPTRRLSGVQSTMLILFVYICCVAIIQSCKLMWMPFVTKLSYIVYRYIYILVVCRKDSAMNVWEYGRLVQQFNNAYAEAGLSQAF